MIAQVKRVVFQRRRETQSRANAIKCARHMLPSLMAYGGETLDHVIRVRVVISKNDDDSDGDGDDHDDDGDGQGKLRVMRALTQVGKVGRGGGG